jgi:putative Ca2+/H+ antiporter (TMEM165/GDT1 family)
LGTTIGRFIPEKVIKIVAGAVFIGFGALYLYEAFKT